MDTVDYYCWSFMRDVAGDAMNQSRSGGRLVRQIHSLSRVSDAPMLVLVDTVMTDRSIPCCLLLSTPYSVVPPLYCFICSGRSSPPFGLLQIRADRRTRCPAVVYGCIYLHTKVADFSNLICCRCCSNL